MVGGDNNLNRKESHINHLNVDTKKSMLSRIIISICLVIVVVPCIFFGDYIFLCLIFLASVIATHEIIKTPQSIERKFNNLIYVFAYIMSFLLIYWIFIKNNLASYFNNPDAYSFSLYNNFESPFISLSAFVISVAFLFIMIFIDKTFTVQDAFYFVSMLFIVSIGFQSIMFLRFFPSTELYNEYLDLLNSTNALDIARVEEIKAQLDSSTFKYLHSTGLLFYMLIGVCLNDVGAYFVGVLFGKHKLIPRISPKKTWEGFIGGIVVSISTSMLFAFLMAYFGYPILNILDLDHWYNIVILSLIMPIVGTFGDLLFSSIKRYYNIKDFGQALKSHGGVLDRLDSILISSIALGLFIPLMEHTWLIYL